MGKKKDPKDRTSFYNNKIAWKHFEKEYGFKQHRGLVLHHLDMDMKQKDPERYKLWIPEDLVVMNRKEHMSLHKKGTKLSESTKEKMRQRKIGVKKSDLHRLHMSLAHKLYWQKRKAGLFELL